MNGHVVMFSGGVTSWAAGKRIAAAQGTDSLVLLFADTKMEDEDTYRFLPEAAANIGALLVTVADGRDPWQVFHRAGVDLAAEPLVGLGSVCRRQATAEIERIVTTLAGQGLRLHGFGVKTAGLGRYGWAPHSADSLAWSYAARREPALPGHRHKNCANCLTPHRPPSLPEALAPGRDPKQDAWHRPAGRQLPAGGSGMTALTAPAAFDRFGHRWRDNPKADLLQWTLAIGVPMRIAEYQRDRRSIAWLKQRAEWAGDMVASHGDILQYRTKPSRVSKAAGGAAIPGTAEVCNALVEGVTCCVLVAAGGITLLGLHFDAELEVQP